MAEPAVSLILVTRRPAFVGGVLAMLAAQTYRPIEIVLVRHGWSAAARGALDRALDPTVIVLDAAAEIPLGACLNLGIAASRGVLIAKIDDDDLYGPGYLAEAVAAIRAGKGDVVGKSEHFVYLACTRELLLAQPGAAETGGQSELAGPTLLCARELALDPGFAEVRRGEDRMFLARCLERELRLYATSRRHFIRRRFEPERHTWPAEAELFRRVSIPVRRNVVDESPAALLALVSGRRADGRRGPIP